MIFVHPFNNNFSDNFVLFYWSKTMKREKKKINTLYEYERELYKNCYKIIIQIFFFSYGV